MRTTCDGSSKRAADRALFHELYVLANRRSGLFTSQVKIASRASVQTTLGLLRGATVVAGHRPEDPLARRVVLLEADAAQVASMRAQFPPDSILEPAVRRRLHRRVPIELRQTVPHQVSGRAKKQPYQVTITAGGQPLSGIDVMLYLRDPGGSVQNTTVNSDPEGKVSFPLPAGYDIAFGANSLLRILDHARRGAAFGKHG